MSDFATTEVNEQWREQNASVCVCVSKSISFDDVKEQKNKE